MTPQQLKNSILQQAIEGKLVEQRPEEGTGEELYQQIQKEKQKLIKEGKIKKEKSLPPITEDEIPFEIPESWKWTYFGNVIDVNGGYAFKSNEYTKTGVRVIRISDFDEHGFNNRNIVRFQYDKNLKQYELKSNDILMCMTGGTVGKSFLVGDLNEIMYVNQRVADINCYIEPKFAYVFVRTPMVQSIIQRSKNSTNDNISMNTIKMFPIPLPPFTEQQRIVAKIEELQPYIDQYEQAYNRLESFNKKFPDDMKKSILQMAIEGKLVEQRPEEGSGEELCQQIQKEKQKLIKEGKISNIKSALITENEIPFEIPESWRWIRLSEIARVINGRAYKQSELLKSGKTKVLRVGNLFTNNQWYYSDLNLDKDKYCDNGDLIYAWSASFGPFIWNGGKVIYHYHIWKIEYAPEIDRDYFYDFLLAATETIKESGHGVAMVHVTKQYMEKLLIPLPPLAEQKRIVAKIEELLPLCDQLKQTDQ